MAKNNQEKIMERINLCNQYKELIADYPDKFNLQGIPQKSWLNYYDEEISRCINQLENQKSSKKMSIAAFSFLAVILISSFFLLKPSITTFAGYTPDTINFEVNKTVSLHSYILISSESSRTRINISEFNLEAINKTYFIPSLTIPLNKLNLPQNNHLVIISLIDNNQVIALTRLKTS